MLKRRGVSFKEIDIAANWERRDEMLNRANGRATLPQIFYGGTHIGGYAELQRIDAGGGFENVLADTSDRTLKGSDCQ